MSDGSVDVEIKLEDKRAKSQANKVGKDIGNSVKDGAKTAEKALDGVSSKFGSAFKDGSKSASNAIGGVGDSIRGVGNDADNSEGRFSSAFKSRIPAATVVAAAAIAAVTAKVLEFAKESVQSGIEFDKAMSQVAATMGVTTDEVQDLRDFAQEMGATTAFSATQAAEALNYMALAGYDADTSMKMLPTVLNLAAAGNIELAEASDMVTDAQSALGLSLDETSEMVDKMAKASSKSNTSVAQLGQAFLTVGGTAKSLKGGTTELSTALGILADNGIKGAEGGTALRNIILSLSAPTDNAAGKLQELGVQVFDNEGKMRDLNTIFKDFNMSMSSLTEEEKINALNTIFNKVDLKSVNALLANTTTNTDELKNALEETGVSLEGFGWSVANGDDAALEMSKHIMGYFADTNGSIEDTVSLLQNDFVISTEDATLLVEALAGAASTSSNRFDELSGYIDDAAGAAQAMADTQLDNLAGDLTLLESATEGFQISISDYLTPSLRALAQVGGAAFSDLKESWDKSMGSGNFTGAGEEIGRQIINVVNTLIAQLPELIATGVELIGGFLVGIAESIPSLLTAIVSAITQAIPLIIEAAINVVQALIVALPGIVDALIDALPQMIEAVASAIPATIDLLVNGVTQLVYMLAAALPQIVDSLVKQMPLIVKQMVTALVSSIQVLIQGFIALFTGVVEALPVIIAAVIPMIPAIVDGIVTALIESMPALIEGFVQLFMAFVEATPLIIEAILPMIPQIITAIVVAIVQLTSELVTAAIKLFLGFIEGIVKSIPGVVKAVADVGIRILSTLATLPGKMIESGKKALNSFLDGITNVIPSVINSVASMGSSLVNTISGLPGQMLSVGHNIVEGLWNGIGGSVDWLVGKIRGFCDDALGAIKGFFGIASPAKRLRDEVGKWLPRGIAVGWEMEDLPRMLTGLLDKEMAVVEKKAKEYSIDIGSVTAESITVGFDRQNPMAQIADTVRSGFDAISMMVQTAGNSVTNNTQNITFERQVNSPDEMTRELRMWQRYDLAGKKL